jgi:hypothetical protein
VQYVKRMQECHEMFLIRLLTGRFSLPLSLCVCLRAYVCAKVEWNEKYNLDPPVDPLTAADLDGNTAAMLTEHEKNLEEYLKMFDGDTGAMLDGGYDEDTGEEYDYEKDDGYEGDLHLSLGSLYMALGGDNSALAASHLEQAVRLYELSGEREGDNTATAKFNLAILHLRSGDYRASARWHGEALDGFLAVTGETVPPARVPAAVNELSTLLRQLHQSSPHTVFVRDDANHKGDQTEDANCYR